MQEVALVVHFLVDRDGSEYELEIVGDSLQPFRSALVAALDEAQPDVAYFVVVNDPRSKDREVIVVDSAVTLAEVAELFANEVLHVDDAGRGGGGWWTSLKDLANVLPYVGSPIRTARGVYGIGLEVRYSEQRAQIKQWDDTGEISRELEQLVLSENPWTRTIFDRTFGTTRDRGGALFRELGYRRWGVDDRGAELWRRSDPDWRLEPSER